MILAPNVSLRYNAFLLSDYFCKNRGNVGTSDVEMLEMLMQQALDAIKSCGNRLGTGREQSGNKRKIRNHY